MTAKEKQASAANTTRKEDIELIYYLNHIVKYLITLIGMK